MSLPTRSDHLVCADPLCPTNCDPYTGRILCRCYQQMQDSPASYHQGNGHVTAPPPPAYNSLYPQNYHNMEPASGSLQPPPNTAPFPPTTTLPQYPSTLSPTLGTTSSMSNVGSLDALLRSQVYNYMNSVQYANLDLNGTRRKNATRESTTALKAWLKEHKKNPYPTKAEKVMLAIVTKMSMTQISTWFANARRRMKKENGGELRTLDSAENSPSSDDDNTSDSSTFAQAAQRSQDAEGAAQAQPSVNISHPVSHAVNGIQHAVNGIHNEGLGVPPPNVNFPDPSSIAASGHPQTPGDALSMLLSPEPNETKPSGLPSFSTFMGGNSSYPPNMDYGYHMNNYPAPMLPDATNMYNSSYNTTAYSTSDFSSATTGSYNQNYAFDTVANYFKQHPEFAHEFNSTGSDKENHLPANDIQQNELFTDSSAGKSSDSDSSGNKSTDSSPSSVKSKIWSINEIIEPGKS